MKKVLTVVEAGRLGGLAASGDKKRRSAQMRKYWAAVRAGKIKHRGRGRSKPKQLPLPLESESG